MKKGSIELSINFIVIMIISVVILSFGLFFAQKVIWGANKQVATMDDQLAAALEQQLTDPSMLVAIPYTTKETSNGKMALFGVAVVNQMKDFSYDENNFILKLDTVKYFNQNNEDKTSTLTVAPITDWVTTTFAQDTPIPIKKRQSRKFAFGFVPKNAPKGTYVFNLLVRSEKEIPPPSPPDMSAGYSPYQNNVYKLNVIVN